MAFPLTVYGKFGWEKVVTSGKKHKLGTRMELPDGRVFYYGFTNGAIGAGEVVMQKDVVTATHEKGRAVAAAVAGTRAVVVTNTGASLAKDKYADGILFVSDGTAEGHVYIIKSHLAAATTATFKLILDEEDGIQDEAFTTATKVGLRQNKFLDCEKFDSNDIDGIPLGVAPVEVADDRYFWCQCWGSAAVKTHGTLIKGNLAHVRGTTATDGVVIPFPSITATSAATDWKMPVVGIVESVATATGFSLIFLTLSR